MKPHPYKPTDPYQGCADCGFGPGAYAHNPDAAKSLDVMQPISNAVQAYEIYKTANPYLLIWRIIQERDAACAALVFLEQQYGFGGNVDYSIGTQEQIDTVRTSIEKIRTKSAQDLG